MEKEIKTYEDVLSKQEIITIGLLIRLFEDEKISYQELKKSLNNKGIELQPFMHDFSTTKMTIKTAEKLYERTINETFIPTDLRGYIISSNTYANILISYDRTMIELLAEYGDEHSKKVLKSIIKWEIANTFNQKERIKLRQKLKNI